MIDADPDRPSKADDIEATRGREQGLGVGERDLAAQRDAGTAQSPAEQGTETDKDRDAPASED